MYAGELSFAPLNERLAYSTTLMSPLWSSYDNTAPIPVSKKSVYKINGLLSFDKFNIGSEHNLAFSVLKAISWDWVYSYMDSFFKSRYKGAAILLKSLIKFR